MTNSVVVDQVGALDLIDQLRVAVPEEIRQAKRINEETTRLVERAQEEAERILARAQEQAAFLIEERELTRAAELRSQQIITQGNSDADDIRRGGPVRGDGAGARKASASKRSRASTWHHHADERHPDDVAPAETVLPVREAGYCPICPWVAGPCSYNVADLLRSVPGRPGVPPEPGLIIADDSSWPRRYAVRSTANSGRGIIARAPVHGVAETCSRCSWHHDACRRGLRGRALPSSMLTLVLRAPRGRGPGGTR
jgi:vacuolar-type H+-ATPase subunit H